MKRGGIIFMSVVLSITGLGAAHEGPLLVASQQRPAVLDLWADEVPAFGVFVPDERPRPAPGQQGRGRREPPVYTAEGGARLAQNALYDFVFLNLEGAYDSRSVGAIAEGLRGGDAGGARKALLVRIPPIERDGLEATGERVAEILDAGADGVVFPHVRSPEEAAQAVALMRDAGADLWSASNRGGDKIAMIMIEDPDSLGRVAETAAVDGIGILACGIGSLRGALDGDRAAAEAGSLEVLRHARTVGAPDMITAGVDDVEQRLAEGYLALLMQGDGADEAIRVGRAAARRRDTRTVRY